MEACYTIHNQEYHIKLLSGLHVLQQQGVLCDVILVAEDGQVMAHKVVLMAASKYFRDKLSPVISATASKICLKGISIVELSNLIKYMYTGKLLVAIDSLDVILEIAEILELNGVLRGYAEILNFEHTKDSACGKHSHVLFPAPSQLGEVNAATKPLEGISDAAIHEKDVHLPWTKEASIKHAQSSQNASEATKPCIDQKAPNCSTAASVEYCNVDDTTSEPAAINTVNALTHECGFEFNPYDHQYMDISVGSQSPVKNSTLPNPPQLTYMSFASSVVDEQAQHQDLLTVAIETLSDTSQKMGNQFKFCNAKNVVPVVNDENAQLVNISGLHRSQLATGIIDSIVEPFENGKTNTRTVTLSAGSISNELGGKTDVYTVAIDPSTIKEPLKMPRPRKKKTEKEKQAEKTAEMYRKKKAEILHGGQLPVTNSPYKFENTDKHGYLLVGQNLVLNRNGNVLAEMQDKVIEEDRELKTECFVPRVVVNCNRSEKEELLVKKDYNVDHTINMSKVVIHVKSKVGDYFEPVTPVPVYSEPTDFCQVVNFDRDEENAKNREAVTDANAILKFVDSETENSIKEKQDHFSNSIALAEHEVESSRECQKQKHDAERVVTLRRSARAHIKGKEPNVKALDLLENKMRENINALTKEQFKGMIKDVSEQSNFDDVSLEINRSCATKRKIRPPRKLPVSDDEDNDKSDLRETVPSLKMRKLCRNEDSIINNEQDNVDESSKAINEEYRKDKMVDTDCYDDVTCDNNKKDLCEIEENETRIDQFNAHRTARQRFDHTSKSGKDGSWNYSHREDKLNKVRGKHDFRKEMLPEVRLKKQTLQEMFEMARDIFPTCSNISQDTKKDTVTCVELTDNIDRDVTTNESALTKFLPGDAENFIDTDTIKCASSLKKTKVPQCNSSDYFQIVCSSSEASSDACALEVDRTLDSFDADFCMYLGRKMKLDGTLPEVSSFACQEETNQDQSFYKGVTDDEMVDDGQKVETVDVFQQQPDDASYECMMCDFISSSPKVLIDHVKEHVSCGDGIPCKKCCKMFKAIRDLKKHYHIHTDKYMCAYCNYSTSLKNNLREHMKLKHSSETDLYSCKFCTYQTPLAENLQKHVFVAHHLIVITKQTKSCLKYAHFEEGTIITVDGMVFDPDCMELPKVLKNNFPKIIMEKETVREERKHRTPEKTLDKEETKKEKRPRIALNKLPLEEFTKELMKRHEEYLKRPVEDKAFMCSNIALATEQPSFPQASPNVRNTKANKLYNMEKIQHSFIHLPVHSVQCHNGNTPDSHTNNSGGMHIVGNEVEVEDTEEPVEIVFEDSYNANTMILSLPENNNEDGEQMIVISKNGQKSLIKTKDFYASLNANDEDLETSQTLGVISALLEAGEQIEIREQEEIVEIQNV